MRRFLTLPFALFVVFGLLLTTPIVQAQPVLSDTKDLTTDPFPHVARAYWVQTDSQALWARQPDAHLPPASLTKLMTALLVAESSKPEDVVTVAPATMRETRTRLGLRQGEQYSVEDLLAATLIHSANDACHALSAHMAGNEARFVAKMNRRARALGLRDTHFVNACGHDAEGHYSSARDLAALALHVLRHPRLASLVDRVEMPIASRDGRRSFLLKSTNALLGRYTGVQGVKTGYTPGAGKCLIAYAVRGQHRVLLVMLNTPNRWWDATDILDLAFAHAEQHS